jgi:hypothetical protein
VSKWATALLATGLNRLPGVSAVAINPGVVRTHMTEIMAPINKHRSNTNESSKIYAKLSAICSGLREGIVARIMLTPVNLNK